VGSEMCIRDRSYTGGTAARESRRRRILQMIAFGMQTTHEAVAWAFCQIPPADEARPILQTLLSEIHLQVQANRPGCRPTIRPIPTMPPDVGLCSKRVSKTGRSPGGRVASDRTIHAVVLVIDRQGLLAIESDLDKRHISLRKPETADLLVLTYKVGSLYPER